MGTWFKTRREDRAAAQTERRIALGFGLIPAELLLDPGVSDFAVRVYATIGLIDNQWKRGDVRLVAIAQKMNASFDGVFQAVKRLRLRGWITIERTGRMSRYVLHRTPGEHVETQEDRAEYRRLLAEFQEACKQPEASTVEGVDLPAAGDTVHEKAEDLAALTRLVGKVRVPSRTSTARISSKRA